MIWTRAEGSRVWDENGREYIDLTAGFGVAVLGHANPRISKAIASQPVTHALGDLAEADVTRRLRDALHGVWLGHPQHPVMVQVPIGAWLGAALMDAVPGQERGATVLLRW